MGEACSSQEERGGAGLHTAAQQPALILLSSLLLPLLVAPLLLLTPEPLSFAASLLALNTSNSANLQDKDRSSGFLSPVRLFCDEFLNFLRCAVSLTRLRVARAKGPPPATPPHFQRIHPSRRGLPPTGIKLPSACPPLIDRVEASPGVLFVITYLTSCWASFRFVPTKLKKNLRILSITSFCTNFNN